MWAYNTPQQDSNLLWDIEDKLLETAVIVDWLQSDSYNRNLFNQLMFQLTRTYISLLEADSNIVWLESRIKAKKIRRYEEIKDEHKHDTTRRAQIESEFLDDDMIIAQHKSDLSSYKSLYSAMMDLYKHLKLIIYTDPIEAPLLPILEENDPSVEDQEEELAEATFTPTISVSPIPRNVVSDDSPF